MRLKDIIIFGCGGMGREVILLIESINKVRREWNLLGFIVDDSAQKGRVINGYPVLGDSKWLGTKLDIYLCCAIADVKQRKSVVRRFPNHNFATLIDPNVVIHDSVKIGQGSIICNGAKISVDVTIGDFVIIHLSNILGHDSIISNFVTLYPGVIISGNVIISKNVEIGTGSQVIQNIKIGNGSVIGAGSTVINDIDHHILAVGNPARMKKKIKVSW